MENEAETRARQKSPGTSRRQFLTRTAAASLALGGGGALWSFMATDSHAAGGTLTIPDLLESTTSDGVSVFSLEAQTGTKELVAGTTSNTAGYNGPFLGPTLRVTNGQQVRFDVKNSLGEDTTVHWHGAHIPPKIDGGVQGMFSDGETMQAAFTVKQEATTLWFHPHLMAETAHQISLGMAGMLIVTDDSDASAALPSEYGVDDIPLILQCIAVDSDGAIKYDVAGLLGATDLRFPVLVNGTVVDGTDPLTFTPTKTRVRFRILNASPADIMTVSRSDGGKLTQIATDGGYLEQAIEVDSVRLVSAARAEIVMDVTDVATLQAVVEAGTIRGGSGTYPVLQITPGGSDTPGALPATLNTITRYNTADANQNRTIQLTQSGFNFGINGVVGTTMEAMESSMITAKLGDLEVWTVENTTQLRHSFHVHDIQFQIISINGQEASGVDLGWKDTVEVMGAGTVVIAMQFTDFADDEYYYMLHCHVTEHEDEGMMTFLKITESGS